MVMVLILSIVVPIILILLLKRSRSSSRNGTAPPGPPGLPLIGNLLEIGLASNLPVYLWQLSQKYGPVVQMRIGSVPLLVVSSPKLAKEVMKTQDLAFCGRARLLGQKRLSYNCTDIVFSPYGDYWRELRKITTIHLFSLKKVQSFRPVREDEISRMIANISEAPSLVNLNEIALALGTSLICRIAFGKRYDDEGPEMKRFEKLLHGTQAVVAAFYISDYFPLLSFVDRLSGAANHLDRVCRDLDSFYEELIKEHLNPKREKKEEEEEEDDFLDILIKLKEKKLGSIDLDWDGVKAMLMDIFIAASDTSAASTIWTMTTLIKAPKVMHKVQSEIRKVVGKKGIVDEDDFPNLPYLKAVVKEVFRLYPPVPLLVPRETIQKCTLEGYEIEPETVVYVNAWAIQRDPETWENPDEFVPERFLNSSIDIKGQDFGIIPFGSGRRMCPGMPMGLMNVEVAVANLLYSFDWELPNGIRAEDIDTDPQPGMVMHKKNPLLLVAKKYLA